MGFIASAISEKRSVQTDLSNLRTPKEWLSSMFGGVQTSSGVRVTEENAMSLTAVYAAIKIISWTMASLPLIVYKRDGRSKTRASENPVYKLLHDEPNSEQTSFGFRSFLFTQMNLYGAGIAEIEFDSGGTPVALWPIPSSLVNQRRTKNGF